MSAVPFDTLKLARDLEAAGVSPAVAAGTAAALADAMASSDFATKADLALMEARITGALNEGKAEALHAIRALEARMAANDAKLEAQIAASEGKLEARLAAGDGKLDARIAASEAKLDARMSANEAKSDARFVALEAKLEVLRRDMTIKLGGMIFVAVGVILAAMRLMPHS